MADQYYERANYENTVAAFMGLMLKKLRENDHKTHWRNEDIRDLFRMLVHETVELEQELDKSDGASPVKIARECADIGNFALMIADVARGLDEEMPKREAVTIELLQREVLELRNQVAHENRRWKEVFKQHLNERTRRQDLEIVVRVLAEGIGNFQAGHQAPWDTLNDEDKERWKVEDAHSNYVMECSDDDLPDGTAKEHTEEICESVNLADEVATALCAFNGPAQTDEEYVVRAISVIKKTRSRAQVSDTVE